MFDIDKFSVMEFEEQVANTTNVEEFNALHRGHFAKGNWPLEVKVELRKKLTKAVSAKKKEAHGCVS